MINSFGYIDFFIIKYLNSFLGCLFIGLIFWFIQNEFYKKRCHIPSRFYDKREFVVNSVLFAFGCFGAIKMYLLITNHSFVKVGIGESVVFELNKEQTIAFYFVDDFADKEIPFKCDKVIDVNSLNRCVGSVNKILKEYSLSNNEKFISWYPKYLLGTAQKEQKIGIIGSHSDVDIFVEELKKNAKLKNIKINMR